MPHSCFKQLSLILFYFVHCIFLFRLGSKMFHPFPSSISLSIQYFSVFNIFHTSFHFFSLKQLSHTPIPDDQDELNRPNCDCPSCVAWRTLTNDHQSRIRQVHSQANSIKKKMYIDPISQNSVMTRSFLISRGYCCGSGCRHCPYLHVMVLKNQENT